MCVHTLKHTGCTHGVSQGEGLRRQRSEQHFPRACVLVIATRARARRTWRANGRDAGKNIQKPTLPPDHPPAHTHTHTSSYRRIPIMRAQCAESELSIHTYTRKNPTQRGSGIDSGAWSAYSMRQMNIDTILRHNSTLWKYNVEILQLASCSRSNKRALRAFFFIHNRLLFLCSVCLIPRTSKYKLAVISSVICCLFCMYHKTCLRCVFMTYTYFYHAIRHIQSENNICDWFSQTTHKIVRFPLREPVPQNTV